MYYIYDHIDNATSVLVFYELTFPFIVGHIFLTLGIANSGMDTRRCGIFLLDSGETWEQPPSPVTEVKWANGGTHYLKGIPCCW